MTQVLVRQYLACLLSKISACQSGRLSSPSLSTHPDAAILTAVYTDCAFALSQFGSEAQAAIPALTAQMNDDQSPIAAFSAQMIQAIDPAVPTERRLIVLVSSELKENRSRAIPGLVELATPAALQALVSQFRVEQDAELRDSLARAVARVQAMQPPAPTN